MSLDIAILFLRLAVIALVYLFLAQVVFVMRRDLKRSSQRPKWTGNVAARVVITDPGQTSYAPGEAFALAEINTVGRASTNSITLDDDFVSAEHALLSYRQGQWWVEDLASTNGTLVNLRFVDRPTLVSPGDEIQIGRVKFTLERL